MTQSWTRKEQIALTAGSCVGPIDSGERHNFVKLSLLLSSRPSLDYLFGAVTGVILSPAFLQRKPSLTLFDAVQDRRGQIRGSRLRFPSHFFPSVTPCHPLPTQIRGKSLF
jgi:hypothetical protein